MLKKLIYPLAAVALLAIAVSASAIVLDFEDLSGQNQLSANYAGLQWDPNWTYYDTAQPPYNPSSGVERIYTHNYGGWLKFGGSVTFNGSWVASMDVGQEMYWEGYSGGTKIFESAHLAGSVQTYINVNWAGVDEVRFVSTSFDYFIIDDVTYDHQVPDLSPTGLQLGMSILGLGLFALRTRKSA